MGQTLKQTIQTDLIAWTAVASGNQQISNELNCENKIAARIGIYFGLDSATTPVGTEFIIQSSDKDAGDDGWIAIDRIITGVIAPSAIATDNVETAGATVIECGATIPALGDMVLFKNATVANSEIGSVVARVTTGGSESFTLRDGLTSEQAAGTYYNKAEKYSRLYAFDGVRRLRVVVNNNYAASSASCVVRVSCVTVDSIQAVP